jgi:hypothetical protein
MKRKLTWRKRDSWVAVFDILGFSNLLAEAERAFQRSLLTGKIDELVESLESEEQKQGELEYLIFSDTMVIFAPSKEALGYPWFLLQCKNLIKDSIRIRLPLRGAISIGTTFSAVQHPIVIGRPFLEAFNYCEDQDWIGLLLTPTATRALRDAKVDPLRHHFVSGPVPLRSLSSEGALAYRFEDGSSSFESPLLPWLREMQHFAPDSAKEKYTRTIDHVQRHHRTDRESSSAGADLLNIFNQRHMLTKGQ